MRLATDGLAEKFKNMPNIINTVINPSRTLSTVHHQLLIMLLLFLLKLNNACSPLAY